MNIIDCPETQSIWLQLTKNRVTTAKKWQLSSLKTIFYPFEFRCSIVSRILKYIDCCTARRVTVDMDLSESCIVCLADYTLGEDIRILSCSHMFHRKCIDQWIVFGCCCPICRLEIQFCNHTQCKEITIDANFSSYFELPPNAPPRGEFPINESIVDGKVNINRLFYSTLADLMQYAENTMNDLTFDDILQEVRRIASQRRDVDVPAMFNAINAHRARELRSKPAAPSSAPNTINITASTHQEPPPHQFPPETWSDDPPLRSYLETQNGQTHGRCVCCYPDYDCIEIVDLTIIPD